ncbi:MAG: TonB-dependent receptor [Flavobacteriales bacterium]|nr:TonB-dependent receptor [Flavobacteriales bacterium]
MRSSLRTQILGLSCCVAFTTFAQQGEVTIAGRVLDDASGEPVPYATVVAVDPNTSTLHGGTTTGPQGRFAFQVAADRVDVHISFIGYVTDTLTGLLATQGRIELGDVVLQQDRLQLQEVEVVGEVSRTHFELDKRVFTVGKDLSSTGASALEVLNNVPSVTVNVEGEISLRGNQGVQILIDGKPSILTDGQTNALGTITADMIERVEVITNPSAKYDAAGTAGILNIVLKKEEKKGVNGSVSVNTGIPDNHSVGFSFNRRTQKFNLFTQMGIGYRSLPRYSKDENLDRTTNTTVASEGTSYRNETFYNVTLGTDYHIDARNVLTLSGNFAFESEDNPSRTDFRSFTDVNVPLSEWTRRESTSADNPKYQYDLQYKREFKDHEDHTLLVSAQGNFFGKDQESTFTTTTLSGPTVNDDQLTATNFRRADHTLKADYTDPISEKVTIEAGAQYAFNDVGNDYEVRDLVDGEYVLNAELTNDFTFIQQVTAGYATGSFEGKRTGIKLGLRVENTDLTTKLVTTGQRNHRDFTDLFPSGHASYKITELFSMQAGYSRRIYRPGLWELNPFFNITNNFNIRTGNPNLQPEYSDSYEITSILIIEKASLNASVYHLYTSEVIERVSTVTDNVNTTVPLNLGTNAATGFEFNGKCDPARWLTVSGDFNMNLFQRRGNFEERSFDFNGQKWTARLTPKFKLLKDFDVELTGNYNSGFRTVQSEVSGFAFLDMGVRKKMLKGRAVINFSVRDLFASRISENVIDRSDTYLYSFDQRGRFITLGFSYGFGKGEAMTYSGRRH